MNKTALPDETKNEPPRKSSPAFSGLMSAAIGAVSLFVTATVVHRMDYIKGQGFTWNRISEEAKGMRNLATALGAVLMGSGTYTAQKLQNRIVDKNERINHLERVMAEKDALMSVARAKS